MTSQVGLFDNEFEPQVIQDAGLDVRLWERFLDARDATTLLTDLIEKTPWKSEVISIYGKKVPMPRLTCWYGDPGATYSYSGIRNDPLPWPDNLLVLRNSLQEACASKFNSVLLNYYRNGADYMSWHSDDERELGEMPTIASLSLGASRVFQFRPKHLTPQQRIHNITLKHGSLLVMSGMTQERWVHAIQKAPREKEGRVNLTFRQIMMKN